MLKYTLVIFYYPVQCQIPEHDTFFRNRSMKLSVKQVTEDTGTETVRVKNEHELKAECPSRNLFVPINTSGTIKMAKNV